MHQIFDVWNVITTIKAYVHDFYFFSSKIKLVDTSFNCRNIKKAFYFTKKAPFVLKIFKFLHFPFPFVFPFLAIADFTEIL